jgi:hypothetical protein
VVRFFQRLDGFIPEAGFYPIRALFFAGGTNQRSDHYEKTFLSPGFEGKHEFMGSYWLFSHKFSGILLNLRLVFHQAEAMRASIQTGIPGKRPNQSISFINTVSLTNR